MNIVVGIRSIADKNECALEKYRRFIDRVWDKPGFWTMSRRSKPAMSRTASAQLSYCPQRTCSSMSVL